MVISNRKNSGAGKNKVEADHREEKTDNRKSKAPPIGDNPVFGKAQPSYAKVFFEMIVFNIVIVVAIVEVRVMFL